MKNNKKSNKKDTKKLSKKSVVEIVVAAVVVMLAAVLIAVAFMGGTSDGEFTLSHNTSGNQGTQNNMTTDDESDEEDKIMTEDSVKVLVEMESGDEFVLELYPEYAPQTVQNFVDLVNDEFYDGVGFHRIVDGFMAQGGDPEGTGMGGSGVEIPGEFSANGFTQNTLSHTRGVISMARSQNYDSASSQFFICYDDASFLDGQYAAFGKVVEGMEVVDSFLDVERSYNSMGELASPVEPVVMKKLTVIE